MPSEEKDLSTLNISWQTRMASVMRQFNKLSQKPVFDKTNEVMVNILGMTLVYDEPGIQVAPTDGGNIYTLKCEELDV
jgi:hypothetical protein